jgi:hypothetical protein
MQISNIKNGWEEPIEIGDEDLKYEGLEDFSNSEIYAVFDTLMGKSTYINPLDFLGNSAKPSFMKDSKGEFMFTPSSTVLLFGESGAKKSFFAQTAVAEHFGIMVQLEQSPQGLAKRLQEMNYPHSAHARYVFPESKREILNSVEFWKEIEPTLIAFDSFAPLTNLWGGDTNSDQDVQEIFSKVFHPLRNSGHCVLILDHIGKNTKNKDFSIGSQNKRAQVDLALRIDIENNRGGNRIVLAKDRDFIYGDRDIYTGDTYGYLELSSNPSRARVERLSASLETKEYLGPKTLTRDGRKQSIIESLKIEGSMGKTKLKSLIGGNTDAFDLALAQLVKEGVIFLDRDELAKTAKCKVLVILNDAPKENFALND